MLPKTGVACARALAFGGLVAAGHANAVESSPAPASSPGQAMPASSPAVSADAAAPAPAVPRGLTGWRFTPTVSISETITDNVALAPSDRKQSESITTISAGFQLSGQSGRGRLNLSYQPQIVYYANNSGNNAIRQYLTSDGTLEAIDNWLFIDSTATITQTTISPFGAQPLTNESINSNRSEARTYRISPYIRGRLGTTADYQLRYSYSTTSAKEIQGAESYVEDITGTLKGQPNPAGLSWSLTGSNQIVHRDVGGDIDTRRLNAVVTYQFNPQIRASVLGGWESNNFQGGTDSAVVYGAGVDWSPTPRTQLNAFGEKRPFGHTYQLSARHRTRLTSWQVSETKSITNLPEQLLLARIGTIYDLFSALLLSQFPDPVLRDQAVLALLRERGLPRDVPIATAFLTSRVLLQRSRNISVSVLGVRNTATLSAGMVESRSVETAQNAFLGFTNATEVEQRSLSASLSHRLSGRSNVNLIVSQVRSTAPAPANLESTQSSAQLLLSHQIGPKTSGSLGARYITFDSSGGPGFTEKAVTASLAITF